MGHPVGTRHLVHRGVRRFGPGQQPIGTLEPAVRRGEVGEVRLVRQAKPDGAPRRLLVVTGPPIPRIGLLAPGHAAVALTQPPQRHGQPQAGLGRLALVHRRLEPGAGVGPAAGRERLRPGGEAPSSDGVGEVPGVPGHARILVGPVPVGTKGDRRPAGAQRRMSVARWTSSPGEGQPPCDEGDHEHHLREPLQRGERQSGRGPDDG